MFSGYKKQDWVMAVLICLLIFAIAGTQLTWGMPGWGDDFAAYILEGIAISEGDFYEQTVRNYTMHGTVISEEASDGRLVYVWGFPLLLSLVHKTVGFDTVNFGSIFYYKLPSLILFSLMAGAVYLYYRRSFSSAFSAVLSLLFALSGNFIESIDAINVDISFMVFVVLSLLLLECLLGRDDSRAYTASSFILPLALGISLWLTYETRLNGFTVVTVVFLQHFICLIQKRASLAPKNYFFHLCPYLIFGLFVVVSEAILAPATQNISHVGTNPISSFRHTLWYYYDLTVNYLQSLSGNKIPFLWPVLCVFLAAGLLVEGLKWKNLPLSGLLAGTYIILLGLPYTQGLRYLFYVLPIMLLFIAHGALWFYKRLCERINKPRITKALALTLAAVLLISAFIPAIENSLENIRNGNELAETDVYSEEAVELFRYIQTNTPEDALIAFIKPRALYLNTGRMAFIPNINSLSIDDSDYCIFTPFILSEHQFPYSELPENSTLVFENKMFSMYKTGD